MQVDRATLADVRAVAQIHVDAWRAAYQGLLAPQLLASLSAEQREPIWREAVQCGLPELLVARQDGEVRGWAAFGTCRDAGAPATQAELWALYVAPDHGSQGVGRALWRRASERMRAQGCSGCSLWVLAGNPRAIGFYRALGFTADDAPAQVIELGGQQVLEQRWLCPLDAEAQHRRIGSA